MSIRSAQDFLSRVAKDEDFRKGLLDCKTATEKKQYATEAGFEFTGEEIQKARIEHQDQELEVISGGGGGVCCGQACEWDVHDCSQYTGW